MIKVFCDCCNNEITTATTVEGTFNGQGGHLLSVRVEVTSADRADICKECVIDIITNGKTMGEYEDTWKGKDA